MTRQTTNIAASVRQKLTNIVNQTGDDPHAIWTRYAIERLLYRLSVSEFADEFVLKGAVLLMVWSGEPHRPTLDLDLLGQGVDSDERMTGIFQQLCRMRVEDDGLVFDEPSIRVAPIREQQEYHGRRVNLVARLGKARIPVQVDIGFGDVVTPRPELIEFPTLLGQPAPHVRACPQPTVIAEKFHAMVVLGIANSRMKDFYDLQILAGRFAFDGAMLVQAMKATFRRRKTNIPTVTPLALTDEFGHDRTKAVQWNAFLNRSGLGQPALDLSGVLGGLRGFLIPVMCAAAGQSAAPGRWPAGGPWQA